MLEVKRLIPENDSRLVALDEVLTVGVRNLVTVGAAIVQQYITTLVTLIPLGYMDIVKSHVPNSIKKCLHKVSVVSLGNQFEVLERHIRLFKGMDILKSCRDPTFCVTWADILTKTGGTRAKEALAWMHSALVIQNLVTMPLVKKQMQGLEHLVSSAPAIQGRCYAGLLVAAARHAEVQGRRFPP